MADHIKARVAPGTWVVRAAGAVLGESQNAIELTEGSYPAVIYFPREDLAMALFEKTGKTTHCPHKGEASYFTLEGKSGPLVNAAWSYEDPKPAVAAIKDHLAFYTEEVTVEQL